VIQALSEMLGILNIAPLKIMAAMKDEIGTWRALNIPVSSRVHT